MRIALCLEYPIAVRGGVSVLVDTLLREFAARGHEIVLVSPDAAESLRGTEIGKQIQDHVQFDPNEKSIASAKNLARRIAAARVDLAHFHFGGNYGWGNRFPFHCPIFFLNRLGVPCFSTSHLVVGLLDGYCGPQKPFWFKALMLPLAWCGKIHQLRHTHRELAVSQDGFQRLRRWYGPLRNRFIRVYHSRLPDTAAVGPGLRGPIILNAGHIAWRKGQVILAEAFAKIAPLHPAWILQLVGGDADQTSVKQIRHLIREHQLEARISLLGERTDVLDLMRRAAIYVQPSFQEGLPLALQEGMFSGCATIGARINGIAELIEGGRTGLLFEPGNTAQLAAALEQLIADENRREQLGRAAANSIRERGMTAGKMAENYLRLYESIRK